MQGFRRGQGKNQSPTKLIAGQLKKKVIKRVLAHPSDNLYYIRARERMQGDGRQKYPDYGK